MVLQRFAFVLSTGFLLLTACSKDEPDTTLEGSWLLQGSEKRHCNDADKNSGKSGVFIYSTPCNSDARFLCAYKQIVFNGSTYSRSSSSTLFGIPLAFNDQGSYTISGGTLTFCQERGTDEEECTAMEYSISGTTLSLAVKSAETGCLDIDYYLKK